MDGKKCVSMEATSIKEIKNEVSVKEARMSVVKLMVNFIYTEEVQESFTEFRDLLVLADQII